MSETNGNGVMRGMVEQLSLESGKSGVAAAHEALRSGLLVHVSKEAKNALAKRMGVEMLTSARMRAFIEELASGNYVILERRAYQQLLRKSGAKKQPERHDERPISSGRRMTMKEAAAVLDMPDYSVRSRIRAGQIKADTSKRHWYVEEDEVLRYLELQEKVKAHERGA